MLLWIAVLMLHGLSEAVVASSNSFRNGIKGQLILAPLTRGGNVAFRRLCNEFGASYTMSEMAYASSLFAKYKGQRNKERALLRQNPTDTSKFGFQVATRSSDEALRAADLAVEAGATWMDINCGCPIWDVTRRGMGVSMLQQPQRLFRFVEMTASKAPLPVTVKIRIGLTDKDVNVEEVVKGLEAAGAAAVTIHGK